jgi:hypothetical protein
VPHSCTSWARRESRALPQVYAYLFPRSRLAIAAAGTGQQPEGWNRFMLEVCDLAGTVDALRNGGVSFRNDIVTGVGTKQIMIDDPSGNRVELFESTRPAARLARQ